MNEHGSVCWHTSVVPVTQEAGTAEPLETRNLTSKIRSVKGRKSQGSSLQSERDGPGSAHLEFQNLEVESEKPPPYTEFEASYIRHT